MDTAEKPVPTKSKKVKESKEEQKDAEPGRYKGKAIFEDEKGMIHTRRIRSFQAESEEEAEEIALAKANDYLSRHYSNEIEPGIVVEKIEG